MAEPTRLSKVVAAQVPCSRSEAEQYIAGGFVRVDGTVVEEPHFRITTQQVEIDKEATLEALAPVTLLLHKPAGMDTRQAMASLAPAGRVADDHSGIRTVRRHFLNLMPLLELPAPASGLAVFSQDGRVIRKLTEDARILEQELFADVEGQIAPNGLARLCQGGLRFEGDPLPPAKVSFQSEQRLRFAVKGIAPWVVPWMCEQVGLRLVAMKRQRIGRVAVAGLAPGQWRYLYDGERF